MEGTASFSKKQEEATETSLTPRSTKPLALPMPPLTSLDDVLSCGSVSSLQMPGLRLGGTESSILCKMLH